MEHPNSLAKGNHEPSLRKEEGAETIEKQNKF